MKNTCILMAILGLLFTNTLFAQTDSVKKEKKKHKLTFTLTIPGGLSVQKYDSSNQTKENSTHKDHSKEEKKDPEFKTGMTIFDLGINILQDNTNYVNQSVKNFLNVAPGRQNASIFDLRQGKSINVNFYPCLVRFKALHTHGQRIYITSGLGLQLYNFRYDQPITYTRNPSGIIYGTTTFKKDKLAMDYLNVPLMFTFKTRLNKNNWLVYGVGLTEGYRIDSWTKQESGIGGKVKIHDAFGLSDFNTCLTAEFGIDGDFRFYATYQVTSLYSNGIDQHPVSFGIRFTGI